MLANLPAGFMLGPYKIIQQLGQGGMATVYKAYQANMDRYVAVKVLSFQFANQPEILGRFQHEARLVARLEHPHILPVYDFGESSGIPYMVMRYLEAGTLKDRLLSGPVTLQEIDHIFTQLADALSYAHENGVIHRDIKPSNAMLDKRNQVFLTDFGIAKLVEGSPEFTATGAITGTPAYMSPEQVHGMKLDPRTDIYSLAIMLYEMIGGRVPFEAETPMAVILKKVQEPLPPVSKFKPDVHPAIEAVVLKALAKDREERYANVGAFLAAWKKAYHEATRSQTASQTTSQAAALGQAGPAAAHPVSGGATARPPSQPAAREPLQSTGPARTLKPAPGAGTSQNAWVRLPTAVKFGIPLLFVCLCAVVVWAGLKGLEKFMQANYPAASQSQPAQTGTQPADSAQPGSTGAAQVGLPGQAGQPAQPSGWQTWTAANTYFSVLASDEIVVAGGYGGLTFWNSAGADSQSLNMRNGLPGETVLAMFPEASDIFWVGTNEGLARATNNGARWERFYEDHGLDSDFVSAITNTDMGIVVGTQYAGDPGSGLNLYDGSRFTRLEMPSIESETLVPGKLSYNVNALVYQPGTGLWVGTWQGLGLYAGGQWTVYQKELDETAFVASLYLDHLNRLWVGMNEGAVLRFEGGNLTRIGNLAEHGVYSAMAMVEDNQAQMWFAGYEGIAVFNPAENTWKEYTTRENNIPVSVLLSAGRSPGGVLYFGTEKEGLLRFADGKFSTWYIPERLTYGRVAKILESPDGKLWFRQEFGSGFEVYDPASQKFLPEPQFDICCLATWEEDGTSWFIDWDGIRIKRGSQVTYLSQENGLPASYTLDLVIVGQGEAWASTEAGLAHIVNDQVIETYRQSDGLPDSYNPLLFQGSDGSLWVGSSRGLSRRSPDGQWTNYLAGNPFSEYLGEIKDIAEDKKRNVIWVAAYGDGLFRFDGTTWQSYQPDQPGVDFTSPFLQALAVLPDGRIAIGFDYGGLVFFDPDSAQWEVLSLEDGLPHDNVKDIFVGADGYLWLATSGGITRITLEP
jgi:serine/threonine protein kinase/ligand-binding sensor domain-containing protein